MVAGKVAPLLNFIPGWGTVGSLGVGGIATGLYAFSRRKKKNPAVVTQGVAPPVYPQAPQTQQLDPDVIMNLIRDEVKSQAPDPQHNAPEPHFYAPVPTFQGQPGAVNDINYTTAPDNQDLLHWRRTMEAVSKKYPETGNAIRQIERAFSIYKSGVKNGR